MKNSTKEILQAIINVINTYQENQSAEIREFYTAELRNCYAQISEPDDKKDFYQSIRNEFADDPELYVLLLSVIYRVTKEEESLTEAIELLCQEKIDLFTSIGIRTQIEIELFVNSKINRKYRMIRRLNQSLLGRLEELLNLSLDYRPYQERNNKRIVIVTNQLLGDLHAPTSVTKEICSVLKKNLGQEVLLVVAAEDPDIERMQQVWLSPVFMDYIKEYTGSFAVKCFGELIPGYQLLMNHKNLRLIKQLVEEIYEYNPFCILYLGNLTLFADLFRKFTTVAAMPYSDGYAISEAQIMINYVNSQSEDIREMEEYIKERNQKNFHYDLKMPVKPALGTFNRKDYGLEEEYFLITIVGNRLSEEINEEFILLMRQILEFNPDIWIVFIGNYEKYATLIKDELFLSRTKFIGYQKDLVGAVGMMDLFLNPPRQGGGTSAIDALYNGIPVITLGYCDVANYIDPEDVCKDLEHMYELVKRYVMDSQYYQEQSKKVLQIRDHYNRDELVKGTSRMINQLRDLIHQVEPD